MEQFTASGYRLVDTHGRECIFQGINVVDKGTFNEKTGRRDYFHKWDDSIFDDMQNNGFTLVRLGITWDGVEPEKGQYNEAILDRMEWFMDECAKRGIYCFIDFHQDLYGGGGDHAGDGAPPWATITDGYEFKKTKFVWAEGYFWGKAVHRAFDHFWNNDPVYGKGLQDHFCEMAQYVAKRFCDHPAYFGMDFFNEPFPGSPGGKVFRRLVSRIIRMALFDRRFKCLKFLKNIRKEETSGIALDLLTPELMQEVVTSANDIIREFDIHKYSPFLNRVSKAVREVTDKGVLFIADCYYSNTGIVCSTPAITIDGVREEKQCFSPHAYDLMVDTPLYKYANNGRVGFEFGEHRKTQERLEMPVIVGEWGGGGDGTDWFPHVEFIIDLFNEHKWSNTYWCFYNGFFKQKLMGVINRPHAKAVTGTINTMVQNREKDSFTLTFTQESAFDVPSVLYMHKPVKTLTVDGKELAVQLQNTTTNGGGDLLLNTEPGEHTVVVQF